jgi:hypothetical protein
MSSGSKDVIEGDLTCALENEGKHISEDKDLGHVLNRHIAQMLSMQECDDSSENHVDRSSVKCRRQQDKEGRYRIERGRSWMVMRDSTRSVADNLD